MTAMGKGTRSVSFVGRLSSSQRDPLSEDYIMTDLCSLRWSVPRPLPAYDPSRLR